MADKDDVFSILDRHADMAIKAQDDRAADQAKLGQQKEDDGELDEQVEEQHDDTETEGQAPDGEDETAPDKTGKPKSVRESDKTNKTDKSVDKTKQGQRDQGANRPRPGDLVHNGQVIARAGAERRMFEKAQNFFRPHVDKLVGLTRQQAAEIAKLNGQVQGFEQANAGIKELGLNQVDLLAGARLVAALRKDPGKTITYLLTKAKEAGQNVTLGDAEHGTGAIDMAAISNMIEQKLSPLLQKDRAQQEQEELDREAQAETEAFFGQHPDATIHEQAIADIMDRDETLSPREAYLRLKLYYRENNLDWSRPLQDIVANQATTQGVVRQKPRPNGRGSAPLTTVETQSEYASTEQSTDDIIRGVMRELGMRV